MKRVLHAIATFFGYLLGFVILIVGMGVFVPIYLCLVVTALLLEIIFFPVTLIVWSSSGFVLHQQVEKILDKINDLVEQDGKCEENI